MVCPVPGEYEQDGAKYNSFSCRGGSNIYEGLAKNFKKRYPKHKKSLLDETAVKAALKKYSLPRPLPLV